MGENENPPDVIIDLGGDQMAVANGVGDIPDDRAELAMASSLDSHLSLMHEEEANAQSIANIAGHSGVRKYDAEDPLEAMANAKILKLPKG